MAQIKRHMDNDVINAIGMKSAAEAFKSTVIIKHYCIVTCCCCCGGGGKEGYHEEETGLSKDFKPCIHLIVIRFALNSMKTESLQLMSMNRITFKLELLEDAICITRLVSLDTSVARAISGRPSNVPPRLASSRALSR